MKRILLTLTVSILFIPIGISQDLPSYVPSDGLVAYYPFNGNANDESGNGNHGTVTDATLTHDRFDNENSAYSFDGDGDYIVTNSNVGIGQTILTFSFWAKTEYGSKRMAVLSQDCETDCDKTFGLVLNKFLNSANVCEDGHMNSSPQSFGYAQPSHYATVRTTTANSGWNNYVLVVGADNNFSFSNFKFYVNGILQIANCGHNWGGWEYNFPNYPLLIGNKLSSIEGFFHGQIDDIAVWDRALSNEEIYNLYDLPADINLNGVVSAENNLIKNVVNPIDAQDAATKSYVDSKINSFSVSYNDLTDTPTMYTQAEVDAIISSLQEQIDVLQIATGSGIVTDQDGNSYPYLTYGEQVWTVKNAEVVTYRDGTAIPQVTDYTEWENLTTGAWCYYDNDPNKGKLYNWYAVMGIHDTDPNTPNKEFAPEGWHVPTDAEWTTLENHLIVNGYNYDQTTTGNKIAKAMASTTGWNSSISAGAVGNDQRLNNSSDFNAFPEGYRDSVGSFILEGGDAVFWSSTESNADNAWDRGLNVNGSNLNRYNDGKQSGISVRFVRE